MSLHRWLLSVPLLFIMFAPPDFIHATPDTSWIPETPEADTPTAVLMDDNCVPTCECVEEDEHGNCVRLECTRCSTGENLMYFGAIQQERHGYAGEHGVLMNDPTSDIETHYNAVAIKMVQFAPDPLAITFCVRNQKPTPEKPIIVIMRRPKVALFVQIRSTVRA